MQRFVEVALEIVMQLRNVHTEYAHNQISNLEVSVGLFLILLYSLVKKCRLRISWVPGCAPCPSLLKLTEHLHSISFFQLLMTMSQFWQKNGILRFKWTLMPQFNRKWGKLRPTTHISRAMKCLSRNLLVRPRRICRWFSNSWDKILHSLKHLGPKRFMPLII